MMDIADLMHARYENDARGPDAYDCFGLFAELCRRRGQPIPLHPTPESYLDRDCAINQAIVDDGWVSLAGPEVGCAVVIRTGKFMTHVGMVIEGGKFIHTSETVGVTIAALDSMLWRQRIAGFYRYEGVRHD